MKLRFNSRAEDLISQASSSKTQMVLLGALLGFLALLLFGLLSGVSADAEFLNKYFVWLYAANIVVGITLLLVILALVVILAIRWKQGYFGTKLIVKLAMIFGLVGLLPGAILYSVSLQFVGRSIESWFDVKVQDALDSGLQLGRTALEQSLKDFMPKGRELAQRIDNLTINKDWQLAGYCGSFNVEQIGVFDQSGKSIAKYACDGAIALDDQLPKNLIISTARNGEFGQISDATGVNGKEKYHLLALYKLTENRYLELIGKIPKGLAENAYKVQQAYSDYQEKELSRGGLRKMYIGSLTLTMFMALFIAMSLALIFGRQLAQPLLMLLRGTQAVAQGDLSPKPEINTGDELGLLTRQFNSMTRQLADARQSLQESKDFSESILVNLTAGVCVLDANFNLMIANSGAKRILERDLTPVIGSSLKTIPELVHFASMIEEAFKTNDVSVGGEDSLQPELEENINTQKSWQRQIQLYPGLEGEDDVHSHTLLARGTKLSSGQLIIVFDDITDVIAAQRSVAWGEVARRLAHEIKNPLTPIQLSAERISQKLLGKMPNELEEVVLKSTRTIINQVQAMKQMVNDFRDFAKTPTPTLEPLNLNELVREVLGLYEGTSIKVKIDEDCPRILGDATQLRQVIHNVLQNAQDASLESTHEPEIEVRTETVKFESIPGKEEKMVRMTVVDNGPGFPPRILTRAFEPYITTKSKGTGLGLAVVKKIVDEHGARIELKNREKDGIVRGAKISILFNRLAPNNGEINSTN